MAGKLTLKQEAFVHAYLETGNASEAYRRAYDVSPETKPEAVTVNACKLLKNANVALAVGSARNKVAAKHEVTVERIVTELARIAFSDIRKAVKWGTVGEGESILPMSFVSLTPSDQIDADTALAISEVSQTAAGVKIKMHDKLSAIDKLGKFLGMFERDESAGNITVQILNLIGQHPAPPKKLVAHGA